MHDTQSVFADFVSMKVEPEAQTSIECESVGTVINSVGPNQYNSLLRLSK